MKSTMSRVALIGGGANSEHAVSLASADAVGAALIRAGFVVLRLDLDQDGGWRDASGGPLTPAAAVAAIGTCEVLFPMVHGPGGEDGSLAALAALLAIPCVGSGLRPGAAGMDKWLSKLIAAELGVQVADGVLVRAGDPLPQVPGDCVVKPVAAGSSQGVTLVTSADGDDALQRAVAAALTHDEQVLIEERLRGREIDIAVLRRADGSLLVSPPLEIQVPGFFDYTAKYDGSAQFTLPAAVTDVELKALQEHAITLFEGFGCAGLARIDFFLTERGWVFNEINTIPGMTEQSQAPRMLAAAGLDYAALLTELVKAA